MSWSVVQRKRLAIEKGILNDYFSDKVTWINPTAASETRVEVEMKSNSDTTYRLRVYLHDDFPNVCPHLAIVYPPKLHTNKGTAIPLLDKRFHTLGLTVDGFTKLCHFSPELWTADNTLFQVLVKGRLWIEAYEGHLKTGNPMDVYLGEQRGTVDDREENQNVDAEPQHETKSYCCIS